MSSKDELRQLAIELYDVGAVKYGDFVTKVGLKTPIYIDLRVIISYPQLLVRLSKKLWTLADPNSKPDHVCGVPYTALPIATIISAESNTPMIIRRKEAKSYGTKKMIEGAFKVGDRAIVIEDIITSGSSVLETVRDLEKEGLKANEALIIVDREQGGAKNLENAGIRVKSLFRISELIDYLEDAGRLSAESVKIVTDYIRNVKAPVKTDKKDRLTQDFRVRAKSAKNPTAAKLLNLMAEKRSTICLAADFTSTKPVLDLADLAGPHIAALKIHADILEDFDDNFIANLKSLSRKHNFLVMEDRKLADIGHVVSQQYSRGLHHISGWSDFVTAHAISGPGTLDGLKAALDGANEPKGVFLLAEMSSKGALTTSDYASAAVAIGKNNDLVAGFVCQNNVFDDPGQVQLTPGVKLVKSGDDLGQQYNTPAEVVKSGADLVVVGRGVTEADDKLQALLEYKQLLFEAYQNRINISDGRL